MSDVLIGVTEVASATNATVLGMVQSYLKAESKLLPTITDYSTFVKKGDTSVAVPYLPGFSVGNKSENTAVETQSLTFGKSTIALSKHKVVQWLIEKIASAQSVADFEAEALLRATKDLAYQVDLDIITALKAGSASAPDHQIAFIDTTSDVIAKGDILAARKLLQTQNVPVSECFIGVGPEKENELLALSDFVSAAIYGANQAPLFNGQIGRIYGMPVLVSPGFEDFMCIWHKTAVGYAAQLGPDYASQPDLANLGTRYSLDAVYGVLTMDTGKRNVFIDSTQA